MIKWIFHVSRKTSSDMYIPMEGQIIQLNETDIIEIEVSIPIESKEYGEPYLIIGDVPVEMRSMPSTIENQLVFLSVNDSKILKNQHFYNYFGESKISLYFKNNKNMSYHVMVDIKARKANALLASSMLNYILDNMNDMLALCFSKSFVSGDFDNNKKNTMQKLFLLKEIIKYFTLNKKTFIKDHNFNWKNNIDVTENGLPTGPESIFWVLRNLDRIEASDKQNANLKIKNRLYRTENSPREYISKNADVYENRVIYSFLNSAKFFVTDLIKKSFESLTEGKNKYVVTDNNENYVSFDHALKNYRRSIINHHISELRDLNKSIDGLIKFYGDFLGVKLITGQPPRMTSYVLSRPIYRRLFEKINGWYLAGSPNISKDKLLMGLKNLSSIYEIVSLHMIHTIIKNEFGVVLNKKNYRHYDQSLPFKGIIQDRPDDRPYNYFHYKTESLSIELFFEPRIYVYRKKISQVGDLINVSNKSDHKKYGKHYYMPDFIVRFNHDKWIEPLINVLDSKYTDHRNILEYSLPETEKKYLHEIFQIKEYNKIKKSPIKSLLLLYAHGSNNIASNLNELHRVDGDMPVYPQGAGLKMTPNENIHLGSWLKKIYDDHSDDNQYVS